MNLADRFTMTATEFRRWTESLGEGKRYELVAGEPVAMAPERNRHNLVKNDCWLALRQGVRSAGLDCTVPGDGATVEIDEDNVHEPDVTVQCGPGGGIGTESLQEGRLRLGPPGIEFVIADIFDSVGTGSG